ncbi:MAG: hypothetical protein GY927_01230, partial [bacterium]|nr:hypothetical protein [bacterium]
MVEGGLINFDIAIGGIPRSIFENTQTVQSAVAFATLDEAEATFVDNSIVKKGLTLAGAAGCQCGYHESPCGRYVAYYV